MWKTVLTGTTALMVAGSTLVFAQQRPGVPDVPRAQQTDRSAQDRDAYLEARIAALRAGLMLTPEQERNWPTFEEAARGMAKLRGERWRERGDETAADPIERLQQRADDLTRRAAALKRLADAAAPLYRSLDEGQKRRFFALARPMSPGGGFGPGQGHHGMMGPGWGLRGDDRDDFRGRRGMGPHGGDSYHGYGMGPHHWRSERGPYGAGPGMGRGDERGPYGPGMRGRSDERGSYGMGPGMGGRGWHDRDRFGPERAPAPRRELPRQDEEERL